MHKIKPKKLLKTSSRNIGKFIGRLLRFKRRDKIIILLCLCLMMILGVFLFVPFTFAYVERSVVPIAVQNEKTDTLERGESKIVQTGVKGDKITRFERTGTLAGFIFNGSNMEKQNVNETYETQPKKQIVYVGTRRYQFMICSNGMYTYYTDEQMKNEKVGFTSRSEDACAKTNRGVKTKLADDPSGNVRVVSSVSNLATIDPSCHKENITRFSTVYQDRSSLPVGEQQIAVAGMDGFTLVCPGGNGTNFTSNYPVINRVIYNGTGKTSQQMADEQAQADAIRQEQLLEAQREAQRQKQYQCYQSLTAQGASDAVAKYECTRMYPLP